MHSTNAIVLGILNQRFSAFCISDPNSDEPVEGGQGPDLQISTRPTATWSALGDELFVQIIQFIYTYETKCKQ